MDISQLLEQSLDMSLDQPSENFSMTDEKLKIVNMVKDNRICYDRLKQSMDLLDQIIITLRNTITKELNEMNE